MRKSRVQQAVDEAAEELMQARVWIGLQRMNKQPIDWEYFDKRLFQVNVRIHNIADVADIPRKQRKLRTTPPTKGAE